VNFGGHWPLGCVHHSTHAGIDDPGVNDELAFPTVSSFKTGDDPLFRQRDFSGEFSRRITEAFAVF
jgi:hypothetical protein